MLDDGRKVTAELFRAITREELAKLRAAVSEKAFASGNFERAAALIDEITTAPEFETLLLCRLIGSSTKAASTSLSTSEVHYGDSLRAEATSAKTGKPTRAGRASSAPIRPRMSVRLRGSVHIEHSIARLDAEKLWKYVNEKPFVNALGALTGNQAMQQVKAGLDAIYLSGWQVAGDANLAGEMYPDQSLYPANSVPQVVKRINNTLVRADQITTAEGDDVGRLAEAHRRRCRSRFRWCIECVRTDEGHDRSGRRRRALRGSAVVREEVRSHGRQGAGADGRSDQQAGLRASRCRHGWRADGARRSYRCRSRRTC